MTVLSREDGHPRAMNVRPFSMPVFARETAGHREEMPDAELIRRTAYEEGFRKGESDGFAQGERKAAVLVERVGHIIDELTMLRTRTLADLEPQVVQLAIQMARRVIMRELQTDENTILDLTREALKRLDHSGLITITVSPNLYDLFVRHKPSLLTIHPEIAFEVDPSTATVTAVVSSASEEIVVDADELLSNLTAELKGHRAGH